MKSGNTFEYIEIVSKYSLILVFKIQRKIPFLRLVYEASFYIWKCLRFDSTPQWKNSYGRYFLNFRKIIFRKFRKKMKIFRKFGKIFSESSENHFPKVRKSRWHPLKNDPNSKNGSNSKSRDSNKYFLMHFKIDLQPLYVWGIYFISYKCILTLY